MKTLNKRPIFVNSFARGGSNIIWEILQSHPDACAPIGETDKNIWEEARSNKKAVNILHSVKAGYPLPQIKREQGFWMFNYGVFHANNYTERKFNSFAGKYFDDLLYRWKLKSINHDFDKFKTEDEIYTLDELSNTRVVAKHVNGMIYLVPALMELYPDSIHFGLVRNGLALCESRLRRGTFKEAAKFGILYNEIVEKFFEYEKKYPNFYLLKFEDFLVDPIKFVHDIYDKAGLSYGDDIKVRLKAKKHVKADGSHDTSLRENNKYWINLNDIFEFVNPKINENQIKKLSKEDADSFLKYAGDSMKKLGYI
jgi:hypothetical protein